MADVIQFYGVAAAGSVILLLAIRSFIRSRPSLGYCGALLSKFILYPRLLQRHRFFGPWTYALVIIQLLYFGANLYCIVSDTSEAATRAGRLSLINMVPAYFGFHMSFASDLFGISLSKYRIFHASTGCMSILLGLLHTLIHVSTINKQLFGLIAVVSMISVLLAFPIFHPFSYELFLRSHQGLAITIAYALWVHVESEPFPRLCLIICGCTFLTMFTLQILTLLYRNISLRGSPRVLFARHNGATRVTVFVPRQWDVKAGQYINVWIPSISLWSIFQTHPFIIASWSGGDKPSIDLLIEPGAGLTLKIFERAEVYREDQHPGDGAVMHVQRAFGDAKVMDNSTPSKSRIAFFSGPHGLPINVGDHGEVLMIATGFGIIAQLPLLKELIQGFNASVVRTRYVTLVWQLQDHGDEKPASDLLDRALEEDVLEKGYMVHIRIFYKHGRLATSPQYSGRHGRLAYCNGVIDLPRLLEDQIGSQQTDSRKRTLIAVSANTQVRDELRDIVRPYLNENLRVLELDYQPAEKKRRFWSFLNRKVKS